MARGKLPVAPVWDDVRKLDGRKLHSIDLIVAGFPCTDLSVAGLRAGLDGERSGLYSHVLRLTKECAPSFAFIENVPGLAKYLPRVRADFAELGYVVRAGRLSAAALGAPHKRERIFLLAANANGLLLLWEQHRGSGRANGQGALLAGTDDQARLSADNHGEGQLQPGRALSEIRRWDLHDGHARDWPSADDGIRLLDDGVPLGLVGQRLLGNTVPPAQTRAAFATLAGLT